MLTAALVLAVLALAALLGAAAALVAALAWQRWLQARLLLFERPYLGRAAQRSTAGSQLLEADAADAAQLPSIPEGVLLFCAQESEPWAREAMAQRAQALFGDLGDWDAVLQQLAYESGARDRA